MVLRSILVMYGDSGISGILIDRCFLDAVLAGVLLDLELLLFNNIVAILFAIRRFSC